MAWVGSYRANECDKCGEYYPLDLRECPFCADHVNRHTKYRKDDVDEY